MKQLYNSKSGLATRSWGPGSWYFLFSSIMGAYPYQLNKTKEHQAIKRHFKAMLLGLRYTMPCIFCRESFKQFCHELPIDSFTGSRLKMMNWLYLIKDKVNKKLIKQEKKGYRDEKKRLKLNLMKGSITEVEYYNLKEECKKTTFITSPSPPFKEVLEKYESIRAKCSKKAKTCAI